jgi:methionyl-tRNA synthetase
MITKNLKGSTAELRDLTQDDEELLNSAHALADAMRPHMDQLAFHKALGEVEAVVRDANKYFDTQEPWKLKKSDPERMSVVLAVAQETLRCIAISYQPFMPRASAKMLDLLGVGEGDRDLACLRGEAVVAGTLLPKPSAVFPRVEDESSS